MGSLVPGASYIYERVGDAVYSREAGSSERTLIGYNIPDAAKTQQMMELESPIEREFWWDIRQAAKTNPTLQLALDRAIMIYNLSKDNESGI